MQVPATKQVFDKTAPAAAPAAQQRPAAKVVYPNQPCQRAG